ncbi:hypothetical protein [Nonomuraea sp. NPDC048901]|uniref:hypothetical protein n=1 Tax=unclassified Nonomuraea TaxID=2593643 RepID=UPI0033DC25FB
MFIPSVFYKRAVGEVGPGYGDRSRGVEGARRWADDAILVNPIHPGAILETGLVRHVEMTPELQARIDSTEWKTVGQGAATSVFVASSGARSLPGYLHREHHPLRARACSHAHR